MTTTTECGERAALEHVLLWAFLDEVPDLVYFKDQESRFIAVSRAKAESHGLEMSAEMEGRTDSDFMTAEEARVRRDNEVAIMRTGVPQLGKLEHIEWLNGKQNWVVSNKLPLRDAAGEIIGTFGISRDVTAEKTMELEVERLNKSLLQTSRMAGMAEVATGVLHNVGNVLNTLNVSASVLAHGLRQSKVASLGKVAELLKAHAGDLGTFLSEDPKGRRVPELLQTLAEHATEEQARLLKEVETLQRSIDHIKDIVTMQQAYATMSGMIEALPATELVEDALRMNSAALARHDVNVVRDFQDVPRVVAERPKVLQILINLIRNAKYACDEGGVIPKVITVRVRRGAPGRVEVVVADNGAGIAPENLTRIFAHGFTTRVGGHGFGLHSSANAAREMKGSLTAESAGPGKGATFVLELPEEVQAADGI